MISLWSVILIAVSLGLFFGIINIVITIAFDKKSEKAFEEHMKMENRDNPITDYWLKHYLDEENGLCSLCGQSGIIHTEGIRSPSGIEVGRANYCICPNGQSLRMNQSKEEQ